MPDPSVNTAANAISKQATKLNTHGVAYAGIGTLTLALGSLIEFCTVDAGQNLLRLYHVVRHTTTDEQVVAALAAHFVAIIGAAVMLYLGRPKNVPSDLPPQGGEPHT